MIPYSFIAFMFFHQKFNGELNLHNDTDKIGIGFADATINNEITRINDIEGNNKKINLSNCFTKIKRHVLLAYFEKQYIESHVSTLKKGTEKLQNSTEKLQNSLNNSENRLKDLDSRIENNTANYIAILGIFSAIILSFIGGINLFNQSWKYIETLENLIAFISVGLLLLFSVITFLLSGISFKKK